MTSFTRLGCAMLLLGCGCSDEPSWWWELGADFEWRGTYVTISGYDRRETDACGESLAATDDYIATLADFYATDAPLHVDFDWFSQTMWDEFEPCSEAHACTGAGRVVARELAFAHELAHAVSWDIGGKCMSFLEEGLAEYLSDAHPVVPDSVEYTEDIEDLLVAGATKGSRLPPQHYRQAGHFVSFLVEDYGVDAVRSLCEILPIDANLDDWDAATRTALSTPLTDLLGDYAAYPICDHHGYRARLADCGGEPDVLVRAGDEETSFSLRIACDQPEVIGERDGMLRIVERVHVEKPGGYRVGLEHGEGVALVLEQCAPCSEQPHVAAIKGPIFTPPEGAACTWVYSPSECGNVELDGTHAFIFFLPADQVREVTVRIQSRSDDLD